MQYEICSLPPSRYSLLMNWSTLFCSCLSHFLPHHLHNVCLGILANHIYWTSRAGKRGKCMYVYIHISMFSCVPLHTIITPQQNNMFWIDDVVYVYYIGPFSCSIGAYPSNFGLVPQIRIYFEAIGRILGSEIKWGLFYREFKLKSDRSPVSP